MASVGGYVRVTGGGDGRDPQCRNVPLLDYRQVKIAGLRVAFFTENGIVTPTAETTDTVIKAVKSLADAGARVVERTPPDVDRSYDISMSLVTPAFRVGFEQLQAYYKTNPEDTSPTVREHLIPFDKFLGQSKLLDVAEREKTNWEWYDFRCSMNIFMQDYDVMVLPVAANPAVKHGATNRNLADFSYSQMVTLTGHPAAVVRCDSSPEGLPIGVQIVAGTDQVHMAIAVAARADPAVYATAATRAIVATLAQSVGESPYAFPPTPRSTRPRLRAQS
ncbi:MAG: amidase family protein [Pirellulaceae bacterium]